MCCAPKSPLTPMTEASCKLDVLPPPDSSQTCKDNWFEPWNLKVTWYLAHSYLSSWAEACHVSQRMEAISPKRDRRGDSAGGVEWRSETSFQRPYIIKTGAGSDLITAGDLESQLVTVCVAKRTASRQELLSSHGQLQ